MCFEGMEESGSEGLDDLIEQEKDGFFKGVDCVCISGASGIPTVSVADIARQLLYAKHSLSGSDCF